MNRCDLRPFFTRFILCENIYTVLPADDVHVLNTPNIDEFNQSFQQENTLASHEQLKNLFGLIIEMAKNHNLYEQETQDIQRYQKVRWIVLGVSVVIALVLLAAMSIEEIVDINIGTSIVLIMANIVLLVALFTFRQNFAPSGGVQYLWEFFALFCLDVCSLVSFVILLILATGGKIDTNQVKLWVIVSSAVYGLLSTGLSIHIHRKSKYYSSYFPLGISTLKMQCSELRNTFQETFNLWDAPQNTQRFD